MSDSMRDILFEDDYLIEEDKASINIDVTFKEGSYLAIFERNPVLALPTVIALGKTKLDAVKNLCKNLLETIEVQ